MNHQFTVFNLHAQNQCKNYLYHCYFIPFPRNISYDVIQPIVVKFNQDIFDISTILQQERILGKIRTETDFFSLSFFYLFFLPLIIFSSLGMNSGHDENNREPERGRGGGAEEGRKEGRKEGLGRRSCNEEQRKEKRKRNENVSDNS